MSSNRIDVKLPLQAHKFMLVVDSPHFESIPLETFSGDGRMTGETLCLIGRSTQGSNYVPTSRVVMNNAHA